jgi:hypothetical protein
MQQKTKMIVTVSCGKTFLLFQERSGSKVNMLGGEEEPLFSSSCRSIQEEELHHDR